MDLYFVLKNFYSVQEISMKAYHLYSESLFSERQFRQQLAFHKDINYSESVEYMPGYFVNEQEIKEFLIEQALSI